MLGASSVLKFVTHSATVLSLAVAHGWLPGARYTNLRDVRRFPQLGFLDIDWKKYDFARHLEVTKLTRPLMTVARDLEKIREIEADLRDQDIKFYPPTTAGGRARTLWRLIKQRLLRGAAVEITTSALKLKWHREELRRARLILISMELIKPRADGRYVLGRLGPFGKIDELIRDQYLDLNAEGCRCRSQRDYQSQKPIEGRACLPRHKNRPLELRAQGHVATTPDRPANVGSDRQSGRKICSTDQGAEATGHQSLLLFILR